MVMSAMLVPLVHPVCRRSLRSGYWLCRCIAVLMTLLWARNGRHRLVLAIMILMLGMIRGQRRRGLLSGCRKERQRHSHRGEQDEAAQTLATIQ